MTDEPVVERWEGYGYTNIDTIATAEILGGTTYDAGITGQLDQTDVSRERYRYPKETGYTANLTPGTHVPGTPVTEWGSVSDGRANNRGTPAGILPGKTRPGYTYLTDGMFIERDRIPRIGVHQTVTGYGIPDCEVLISGELGITTAAKTDARGIWWAYLPVDDYSKASVRSFVANGGKVYKLLEQTEREEGFIWDEVMQCITRTGNGFRMISRMV